MRASLALSAKVRKQGVQCIKNLSSVTGSDSGCSLLWAKEWRNNIGVPKVRGR